MGKLVLTRRAGESVIVREANGDEWTLVVDRISTFFHKVVFRLERGKVSTKHELFYANSMAFAGGSLELRPARCPSQAILAFDFPRDVTILRTEIA